MRFKRTQIFTSCLLTLATADLNAQTTDTARQAHPPAVTDRLHVNTLESILRFNYMDRNVEPPAERVDTRDPQYRLRTRMVIDLAPTGTTYLALRAETGKGFDNSWDNLGGGFQSGTFNFNLKTLELGQKIGTRMRAGFGGLEFDAGSASETTYASGDSSFVGYRLVVTPAKAAKISATAGNVSEFDQPNVFARMDKLGDLNYVQMLGQAAPAPGLDASISWDSIAAVRFFRQAVHLAKADGGAAVMSAGIVDDLRVELVERSTDDFRFAWAAAASRTVASNGTRRVQMIYSDVPLLLYVRDGARFFFNRGEIKQGRRLSGGYYQSVTPDWEAGVFLGRLVDSTPTLRWTVQVYLKYDGARVVNRALHRD